MKKMRVRGKWMVEKLSYTFILVLSVLMTSGLINNAYAFHSGGVGFCDGCHTMHNSLGNAKMTLNNIPQFTGNNYLLRGRDPSSTCLNCHATNSTYPELTPKVMTYPAPSAGTPPGQYTPGGDFAWLQKNYTWTNSDGSAGRSNGYHHGHSIVALDFGYTKDSVLNRSPGGSFNSSYFGCDSCHDPHGQSRIDYSGNVVTPTAAPYQVPPIYSSGSYGDLPTNTGNNGAGEAIGVYRLLAVTTPILAVSPRDFNRLETTADTRVAYGTGMSEFCQGCHAQIHSDQSPVTSAPFIHPAGSTAKLTQEVVNNYNAYVYTGNLLGQQASSYTSMVPYEEGLPLTVANIQTLAGHASSSGGYTAGPSTGNENVMCISCHRAHATGWDSMTRWNNTTNFLTVCGSYPGTDATACAEAKQGDYAQGRTMAEEQATFYGRPAAVYASYQRSLCNKCHAKD